MNSFFARQLFIALARGAQDIDLRPMISNKSGSQELTSTASLSHRNTRRVKRYREKHTRDEILKKLARDIIEKKRHKRHLENAIQSMHTKLDGYVQTLDTFMENGKKSSHSSIAHTLKTTTRRAHHLSQERIHPATRNSSSQKSASTSHDAPSHELSILKTQLDYLERKLELIRKAKGVDDHQYEAVKSQIDRLSKLVEKKEQLFSIT
ncbi:MAG: hypothetical protein ACQESE_01785 [Nanobdellota archaeon]